MDDICTYQIEVRGRMDENDVNAMSPLEMTVVRVDADEEHPCTSTLFTVRTDQAGLIGLIRHLHGLGLILLSVTCER